MTPEVAEVRGDMGEDTTNRGRGLIRPLRMHYSGRTEMAGL